MRLLSRFALVILAGIALFTGITAWADDPFTNMPYGVTPLSHQIYDLHMAAFYICCGIGVVVFGVLIYSLIKFRRSKGAQAHEIHEHLGVEILWTIIPFVILIVMAVPATKILINIHDTGASQLDIKIVGYQWKWQYQYLNQGISFFSNLSTPQADIHTTSHKGDPWYLLEVDHPLVVPVREKIRLLVTSNDVIHSWWVPAFGIKQDAVPGFINQNWIYIYKPGIYRGQCAELCGTYHGFMPIVVQAVSQADFAKWVAQQRGEAAPAAGGAAVPAPSAPMTKDELVALGKTSYEKTCAMCHQANGQGMPPTFPALIGSKIVTGPIGQQIAIVLNGKPGTAMQAFGPQLDDKTIAAIITYTRQAWGNEALNTKNKNQILVQPSDIQAARKGGQ